MEERWDVIIVGARCAGATLATLLAREGLRVLLLESSSRGTNMPMSTHLVQSPGMDVLDRLGLGERVRACTPASSRLRFALDDAEAIVEARPGRAPYCIRHATLDPWLHNLRPRISVETASASAVRGPRKCSASSQRTRTAEDGVVSAESRPSRS